MTGIEKTEAQRKSYRQYEIERNKLDKYTGINNKEKDERRRVLWQEMNARREAIERK